MECSSKTSILNSLSSAIVALHKRKVMSFKEDEDACWVLCVCVCVCVCVFPNISRNSCGTFYEEMKLDS